MRPDLRQAHFVPRSGQASVRDVIRHHLPWLSDDEIREQLRESQRLGGRALGDSDAVVAGEAFQVRYRVSEAGPIPDLCVRHDAGGLLALDKPRGAAVHPTGAYFRRTLTHALAVRGYLPAWPLHRIDVPTTGLVLFSRCKTWHRRLSQAWAQRRVRKTYLAWVSGHPSWAETVLDAPLGPSAAQPGKQIALPDGKPSRTLVSVMERGTIHGRPAALVSVEPATGRRHQIRAHLSHAGHPLVGDALYADSSATPESGLMLHAARLEFMHPATGEAVSIHAPLPADFPGGATRNSAPVAAG